MIFTSIVLAHKAVLRAHESMQMIIAPSKDSRPLVRDIYSSSGLSVLKPNVSFTSVIIISILISIQVAGLIVCAVYIVQVRTWTRVFNAMAIARIRAGLSEDILPIDRQYAENRDYERLRDMEVPLRMASTV